MCFSREPDRQQRLPRPRRIGQGGQDYTSQSRHGQPAVARHAQRPDVQIPLRQMRPPISKGHIPPDLLHYIARVIDYQLGNLKYAVIGGVALLFTWINSPHARLRYYCSSWNEREAMARLSRNKELFGSAQGGMWVNAENGGRYNLDIIEPRHIEQRFSGCETIKIQGDNALRPSLLLEYK